MHTDLAQIKAPPVSFWSRVKHLGPSLILTANVVGSGELIMTTSLGAEAGFITLWIVIISCMVKVTIQFEFGRHSILTGNTTMYSFNNLPGPKLGRTGWAVWIWLLIKTFQMVQYGGIVGGVALAFSILFPGTSLWIWAIIAVFFSILLNFSGRYELIEKTAIFLVASFSFFTLYSLLSLQSTPFAISADDLLSGLSFHLPPESIGVALAVFGITGVGADEIISYPYWCVEKGYSRFVGAKSEDKEWEERARGWIRVMYMDGILSLVIYTVTTLAFYLLGAAVLHGQGGMAEGSDLIRSISRIYTESIGESAMVIFLVGAIVILFSTLFVANASSARMYADSFSQLGFFDYSIPGKRIKWVSYLSVLLPLLWLLLFFLVEKPGFMIMIGAISLSILLILVVFSALIFRYKNRISSGLDPGRFYDLCLWISVIATLGVGIKSLMALF